MDSREDRLRKLMAAGVNGEVAMAYANCRDIASIDRVAAKVTRNIAEYGELPLDKATIEAAESVKKILFGGQK